MYEICHLYLVINSVEISYFDQISPGFDTITNRISRTLILRLIIIKKEHGNYVWGSVQISWMWPKETTFDWWQESSLKPFKSTYFRKLIIFRIMIIIIKMIAWTLAPASAKSTFQTDTSQEIDLCSNTACIAYAVWKLKQILRFCDNHIRSYSFRYWTCTRELSESQKTGLQIHL
jgi:hypothetical protein